MSSGKAYAESIIGVSLDEAGHSFKTTLEFSSEFVALHPHLVTSVTSVHVNGESLATTDYSSTYFGVSKVDGAFSAGSDLEIVYKTGWDEESKYPAAITEFINLASKAAKGISEFKAGPVSGKLTSFGPSHPAHVLLKPFLRIGFA